MKTTTRLVDYVQSELINNGFDEFINKVDGKTQITLGNRKYVFIGKMMNYDDDVDKIVTPKLFNGVRIQSVHPDTDPAKNNMADLYFKKAFMNRFLNREIGSQTIEVFASKLTEFTLSNMAEIYILATQLEDYFSIHDNTKEIHDDKKTHDEIRSHDQENLSGGNSGQATLPQTDVNLDLTRNDMNYADVNDVSRGFLKDHSQDTDDWTDVDHWEDYKEGTSDNPDVFAKLKNVWENDIWKPLDKACFLQVYI